MGCAEVQVHSSRCHMVVRQIFSISCSTNVILSRHQVIIFAVPRNIARLTLGHGIYRTIIPMSWPTPGQCDLYIFAMASDLSVDPPEDHDQRPSTILFESIATANTDIIFRFLQTEVENTKW